MASHLIYIDPPFGVGADFTMQVQIADEKDSIQKDQSMRYFPPSQDLVHFGLEWGPENNPPKGKGQVRGEVNKSDHRVMIKIENRKTRRGNLVRGKD